MEILEKVSDAATSLLITAVMGISGGIMWLIRRVITNQSQIEMLQNSLAYRDKRLDEIRNDIREVRKRMDRNP